MIFLNINKEATGEERLKRLQNSVKDFETKKIRAESEQSLLKQQHTQLLAELKDKGIEDVNQLPELIEKLEEEFERELSKAETEVEGISQKVENFNKEEITN
jgi:hypothetical protein